MPEPEPNTFFSSLDNFASTFYGQLALLYPGRNLICSPLTIQSCLAMLRMGAVDGTVTAKELDKGIGFVSNDTNEIAEGFQNVLATYQENSNVVHMANRMYLSQSVQLRSEFVELLTEKFYSEPENIDFAEMANAANIINDWIVSKTKRLIKNLVRPEVITKATKLILVNVIHFKCEWRIRFDKKATRREFFYLDDRNRVKTLLMKVQNTFHYADLKELDAKALRLSYTDGDLHMLIVLPNKNDGLGQLQQRLLSIPLTDIISGLSQRKVNVKLPKFTAEYETELSPVIEMLGIKRIFIDKAELGKISPSQAKMKVSKILHKAFVEVNEEGNEAVAVSEVQTNSGKPKRPPPPPMDFHADHPFYFVIYDAQHGPLLVGNLQSPVAAGCIDAPHKACLCER
ncbi:serine protease inhibitor 42Dd-like [Drosophila grimshawi]|uniref:serine protease inhibitor 42Dd-like n=1 Tax=Drosophila grimshawi TaxID=7222 RepID=UPI000C870A2B|nr:serine protease inhibitor 42Dd-like [Drosophila grimshawi]